MVLFRITSTQGRTAPLSTQGDDGILQKRGLPLFERCQVVQGSPGEEQMTGLELHRASSSSSSSSN
eukprot:10810484-Heterocapsa_arctica.AAC.1